MAKIEHVFELGFSRVLISFDDVIHGLDPEEAARFAESNNPVAEAHAAAIIAVGDTLGFDRVIACPLHYWGIEGSSYRRVFASAVPSQVPFVWTGPAVISSEVTAGQAKVVSEELDHPIWLWDNYPVNDWDIDGIAADNLYGAEDGLDNLITPRRLPLAPLSGRDPELADVVQGMGTNLALDPWMGIPAALTLLAFAWQGSTYEAESAWRAAVTQLNVDPDALAVLRDAAGPGSGVPVGQASAFAKACARVLTDDDRESAIRALELVVQDHVNALISLRGRPSRFTRELRPWLVELGRQCHLATLAISALCAAEHERSDLVVELRGALLRSSAVSVGSGMGRALAEYARGVIAGGTPPLDVLPFSRI